ncbi:hypothetical protein [Agromyces laixinhei]|uniref:hypothetical protein n=1 Tax=Agromyces laixinhei TaxID=2585717 RepID=UPI0012EE11B5|nr:hypothetical protein [Agromyces laixinhei]
MLAYADAMAGEWSMTNPSPVAQAQLAAAIDGLLEQIDFGDDDWSTRRSWAARAKRDMRDHVQTWLWGLAANRMHSRLADPSSWSAPTTTDDTRSLATEAAPCPLPGPQPYGVSFRGSAALVRDWLRHLGAADARIHGEAGSGDGFVEVISEVYVAWVIHNASHVDELTVRGVRDSAAGRGRVPLVFTSGKFTAEAMTLARVSYVALLHFDPEAGELLGENDLGRAFRRHALDPQRTLEAVRTAAAMERRVEMKVPTSPADRGTPSLDDRTPIAGTAVQVALPDLDAAEDLSLAIELDLSAVETAPVRVIESTVRISALLIASEAYALQKKRLVRRALDDSVVARIVDAADERDGRVRREELAGILELPLGSMDNVLAVLRRTLNVDGFETVSTDADQTSIVIDRPLLREQFSLK